MGEFDYTVTTTASPQEAVAYLADLRHLPEHVSQVTDVREGKGDGTYAVRLARLLSQDMVVDYVVRTTGSTVVATGTHDQIDVEDRWDVTPHPEGSEIRYRGTYELKGASKITAPLSQLFGKAMAGGLGKRLKARLDERGALPAG